MSSHDESETCRTCHVLHGDGPAHICTPYAVRWPEGPTDAEVKRGLNRLMSTMADMVTKLSAENRELKERIALAEKMERHADNAGSVDALARVAAEAEVTRLRARWEALSAAVESKLQAILAQDNPPTDSVRDVTAGISAAWVSVKHTIVRLETQR